MTDTTPERITSLLVELRLDELQLDSELDSLFELDELEELGELDEEPLDSLWDDISDDELLSDVDSSELEVLSELDDADDEVDTELLGLDELVISSELDVPDTSLEELGLEELLSLLSLLRDSLNELELLEVSGSGGHSNSKRTPPAAAITTSPVKTSVGVSTNMVPSDPAPKQTPATNTAASTSNSTGILPASAIRSTILAGSYTTTPTTAPASSLAMAVSLAESSVTSQIFDGMASSTIISIWVSAP